MRRALLAAALLAAAVECGAACFRVTQDGRPLPFGFGSTGGALARLRDGRFCAEGGEPAVYSAFDLSRIPVKRRGQELEIERPAEGGRSTLLLRAPGPLDDTLVGVCHAAPCNGCHWRLVSGAPGPVELPPTPCGLRSVWAGSRRWGLSSLLAPDPTSGFGPAARPAGPSLIAELGPAAPLTARVRLPDGGAFRASLSPRSLFWLRVDDVASDSFNYYVRLYADENGRIEAPFLARGVYAVSAGHEGELPWAPPPARLVWHDGASTLDYPLRPGGSIAVERACSSGAAVIGLEAGAVVPLSPALSSDRAAFFLRHEAAGWNQNFPRAAGLVPAGRYEAVLARVSELDDRPYVRLLSRARTDVPAGGKASLEFADCLPEGEGALSGTLTPRLPPLRRLRRAGSTAELFPLLTAAVEVSDEAGRAVGTAYTALPPGAGALVARAFVTGDEKELRAAVERPRPWRLPGLPPGRYRVSVGGRERWETVP